jgi:hypothetical protein
MPPTPADKSKYHLLSSNAVDDWEEDFDGFSQYGFRVAQHHRATDFFLIRGDGSGLRFSIVMIDLAERMEVGVLSIESAKMDYVPEKLFELPPQFQQKLIPERLVLATEYGKIDSGLVLTAVNGDELILVSGVYPYTIEVRAPFAKGRFEPEYRIDKYFRQPIMS